MAAREPTLFALEPEREPEAASAPPAALYCEVALNRPLRRTFTYAVPDALVARVRRGVRVWVPFGGARLVGVVVETCERSDVARVRPVAGVLDGEPPVGETLLALTRWIAERYACGWGEALAAALPAPLKRGGGLRRERRVRAADGVGAAELAELEERFPKQHRLLRALLESGAALEAQDLLRRSQLSDSPLRSLERRGWVTVEMHDASVDPLQVAAALRPRPEPTEDQARAIAAVCAALEEERPATFLLHGVTGSGKTEVYLRAIERSLALGRGAIVLVPEIALTPQTVSWFHSRFGEVSVLHSRLSDAQRLAAWKRIARGESRVVVGARSALFAPLPRVGVIVVDEEHEPSFKQASTPRYHARDAAVERARLERAVCVLGSATPALESWHAAERGAYARLSLPRRVGGGSVPQVSVVDMRAEAEREAGAPLFSRLLLHRLAETLAAGEQAILFLNRRGFIPVLWCAGCRETVSCEHCDLALTWHRRIGRLVCHGCCEERAVPRVCPRCTAPFLRPFGVGSEKVEAELCRLHPDARVRRMDSDTMHRREDYEEVLAAFGRREIDVLVGTQMIAKGLDFPAVTLVGIVSADSALHLPDFRAAERTFQLVAQVSGRAGRSHLAGRIVIQTSAPDHPAIRMAAAGDYEAFARAESRERAELGYPPHGRLLRALFEHPEAARADASAAHYAALVRARAPAVRVLGPAPAPIAILRARHRAHFLVKGALDGDAFERAAWLLAETPPPRGLVAPKVDVDAMAML